MLKTLSMLILISSMSVATFAPLSRAEGSAFSFAAAGDLAQTPTTNASLARLPSSGANFFLALGDLSYREAGEEPSWCNLVQSYVGATYPFELLSGSHEAGAEQDLGEPIEQPVSLIDNFVKCLPDRMGSTGVYGKEYYFDYPHANPLARIILISPAMNYSFGGYYDYKAGRSHYVWLSQTIDAARSLGIPWIIVGMYKDCLSTARYSCEVSQDLTKLLIDKKVDLVFQAHDHDYQRSKQLTCENPNVFLSSCVANDGSAGIYKRGQGTIFVIQGTFGQVYYNISASRPDYPYFASAMGFNTTGKGHGFVVYTVSQNMIHAQTNFSGTFSDSFTIVRATPPTMLELLISSPGPLILVIGISAATTYTMFSLVRKRNRTKGQAHV